MRRLKNENRLFQVPFVSGVFQKIDKWSLDCVYVTTILPEATFCMPLPHDSGSRGQLDSMSYDEILQFVIFYIKKRILA